ncbi:MAG: alpha/beta fold hydrolase [Halobacteriales archaeon]
MPTVSHCGASLYYETSGADDTSERDESAGTDGHAGSADPVVFVPDLGCGVWLWGWQAPALAGPREAITWDLRGCGRSGGEPADSIATMAGDLEAVLADCGVSSAAVVGAGMGGMVALQYALDYSRTGRLVLFGATADGARFDAGAFLGDPGDLDALTSAGFREAYPDAIDDIAAWREAEDASEAGKRAHAAAVAGCDLSGRLHEITQPALVAHGEADTVVPIEAGEALAGGLPRGSVERFAEGSHFFFVEQARLVSDVVAGFLEAEDGR